MFDGVLTEKDGYITEGKAYIHFFPNGFTEQAILYLAKTGSEQVFYSMVVRPSSGKVELHPGAVETF